MLLNESFEVDTENPFVGSSATITRTLQKRVTHKYVKHCLDLSFVFSAPLPAEETCFSKRDLLRWKVPAMLYWDLLTSGRYKPACHYF